MPRGRHKKDSASTKDSLPAVVRQAHPITGEQKAKQTKNGERFYNYYRCTYYNVKDHPRVRVTQSDLDRQVLAVFDWTRIEDEKVRSWFRLVLASQTRDAQADSHAQREELQRQESLIVAQQDRLLNMRIAGRLSKTCSVASTRKCVTASRQSSCNWTWTAPTTKTPSWPRIF